MDGPCLLRAYEDRTSDWRPGARAIGAGVSSQHDCQELLQCLLPQPQKAVERGPCPGVCFPCGIRRALQRRRFRCISCLTISITSFRIQPLDSQSQTRGRPFGHAGRGVRACEQSDRGHRERQAVQDFEFEAMKKQRLRLKDSIYLILRSSQWLPPDRLDSFRLSTGLFIRGECAPSARSPRV